MAKTDDRSALAVIFSPLTDYVRLVTSIFAPRDFAARIRGGEISGASVARNFLAAAVLASVLQAVLKLPPLTPIDIPYLSDVVVLTISTLAAVLFIIPFHFALNLGKRGVRVRDAAILMISTMSIAYPIEEIEQFLKLRFQFNDAVYYAVAFDTLIMTTFFSRLYERNWLNTVLTFFSVLAAFIVGDVLVRFGQDFLRAYSLS